MGDMETVGDVLEFAIGREAEAAEFYMAMAGRMTDHTMQTFFEGLVTQELEHKSKLELEVMKEGIVAKTVGTLPEVSSEGFVVDPDTVAEQMDYTEALGLAIKKEKRSFRLYARLSGLVTEEEMSETLLSLAEEEARHMAALEEQYKHAVMEQE
ncbi:MAG: ferritin family protein [Phycisphaerales bacterium]|nr:MAG: ferritin family protein [Phycisphaerales bacterium]